MMPGRVPFLWTVLLNLSSFALACPGSPRTGHPKDPPPAFGKLGMGESTCFTPRQRPGQRL